MPETKAAWKCLALNVRLALAAWLVCKAQSLTPAEDWRTQGALGLALSAMIKDDEGREVARVFTKSKT